MLQLRTSLITAAILSATLLACGAEQAGRDADRPNVLLITMDTTRADRIGCYGYAGGTTPALDDLALESIRYSRAFATAGITPVAHASILTGLFPYQHGARVMFGSVEHRLNEEHPTLASVLRDRGWRTGAFVSAYPASEEFGLDRGFDTFDSGVRDELRDEFRKAPPRHDERWLDQKSVDAQRRGDATVDRAVDWLGESDAPFFAWVHLFDPHDPRLVPPPSVLERFEVPGDGSGSRLQAYDPEIYFMDRQISRLFEALKKSGRYEETVVVVTSDHGQGLGDHGWFQHRLLYQEQIHIPLLVKPGDGGMRMKPGVENSLVRSVDLFPSVLALAGVDPVIETDGLVLPGLGREAAGVGHDPRIAYAEALIPLDTYSSSRLPKVQWDNLHVIVEGPWKLIHHAVSPENSELYHLLDDPGETQNLWEKEIVVRERLFERLRAMGALQIAIKPGDEHTVDPEAERKLRSLGYIGG